jgi:hypothetical protein
MITVQSVVDRVGPTLLHTRLAGEGGHVADVVIAEPGRHDPIGAGDLVLRVGVHATKDVAELVRYCGGEGAAGVLLKPPLAVRAAVPSAAQAHGTALVEVNAGRVVGAGRAAAAVGARRGGRRVRRPARERAGTR